MKIFFAVLTTACFFFLISCGNSSENSLPNSDTTTADHNAAGHIMPSQDTTSYGGGLMKPMDDMMTKMHSVQMTGDLDVDWANMMIEHHQSALDMAQVELAKGKDDKMKAKAQEIITKQQEENKELRAFVQNYKPSGMKHGEGELQKSMQMMMDNMNSMKMSGDIDKDFATMMISHHEDGIAMAKLQVKNGMANKLKELAQNVITDQQREIDEFKAWLSANN